MYQHLISIDLTVSKEVRIEGLEVSNYADVSRLFVGKNSKVILKFLKLGGDSIVFLILSSLSGNGPNLTI